MGELSPVMQPIFGKGLEKVEKKPAFHKTAVVNPEISLITDNLNNIVRRLKVLEERQTNLRRKTQVTDQNMLEHYKKIATDLKVMDSEIMEMKKELFDMKSKMRLLIKELQGTAKKEEVLVLKKYINLWQPMNFVTQGEVENLIKEIIEEKEELKATKNK